MLLGIAVVAESYFATAKYDSLLAASLQFHTQLDHYNWYRYGHERLECNYLIALNDELKQEYESGLREHANS